MKSPKAVENTETARVEAAAGGTLPDWRQAAGQDAAAVPDPSPVVGLPLPASAPRSAAASGAVEVKTGPALKNAAWKAPSYEHSRRVTFDQGVAARNRCTCLQPDAPEQDYYKVLRTQLMQRMRPMGWNTVMITSMCPGEGKSLTAVNLAAVFAKAFNQTVLLVDCNLREQSVWRCMGLPGDRGLVDYLVNGMELKDLIIYPGIEKMTVISGGVATAESSELLESPRMGALMAELKGRYDDRFIILDAPPILGGADAMILSQYTDGIVVVAESGKTSFKAIQNAMELIPKEKFLGFVLNKHDDPSSQHF